MASQRLLVVLDPPVQEILKEIAKKNKVSVSSVGRDLIKEALEIEEDIYWDKVASQREKNFNWKKGLTHKKVWG
jgi:hypothetical protein